jgi:asparagine synthase (glutamine-hydrolysing)
MCGLSGFWCPQGFDQPAGEAALRAMARTLVHRGPDDEGLWMDATSGIAIAHRRLSIVDLSPAGHQPMRSPAGRYTIVYNGEIYNHAALREALDACGHSPSGGWRGHSDTETLLAGFEAWGVEATLRKAIGMFAFALWDAASRSLTIGRDRVGEKPLYWGWQGTGRERALLFGSELKALRVHPAFDAEIDRAVLAQYMRYGYVPAPRSIYRGIAKLSPGTILRFESGKPHPLPLTYWSAADAISAAHSYRGDAEDAADELEALLRSAVAQQMVADVPLGAFLSGGVDSSTIVALMQAQSLRPVKTFSIGFKEAGYDEAKYAAAVAAHLGTDHTELYVTPAEALSVVPRLPQLYDEPFADSSQIPTYLVASLARQSVTVSLSGDAGDELFCGYRRYSQAARAWRWIAKLPRGTRSWIAGGVQRVSPRRWNRLAIGPLAGQPRLGETMHKAAAVLDCPDLDAVYRRLVSQWPDPTSLVLNVVEPPTPIEDMPAALLALPNVARMMALDLLTYLPDDILVKVDRAAMGVSLETRVPLLDHRVVEFAWRLPQRFKIHDGQTKWLLRQVLYRHVPRALIERPKAGFAVPIDAWLRGPLRAWAQELLDPRRLASEGFLNPAVVSQAWQEHQQGTRDRQHQLWNVLMFQAWLEEQRRP